MAKVEINSEIINLIKKYLASFSKSLVSRFYTRSDIDKKMAEIDTRSEIGNPNDYGLFFPSSLTGLVAGNYITFDKICTNNNIEQNGNYFILKANKTYQIKSYISGKYCFGIFNADDGTQIGQVSYGYSNGTDATGNISIGSITTTKDTQVGIKVTLVTPLAINNIYPECSFIEIQETSRTIVLDPAQQVDKEFGIQDTPVGHIMSVMGINAPEHYLVCDGSIYNILDYQKLANYFLTEFGSISYFGGDGITTFAVPDMREVVPVGTGKNTTFSIESHDTYNSGQFKDDQMQKITGNVIGDSGATNKAYNWNTVTKATGAFTSNIMSTISNGGNLSLIYSLNASNSFGIDSSLVTRTDETNSTHGKQIGVLFCIKFEPTYFMNYSPQYAGFDTKTLFDGTANVAGDYVLSDDINNYQFLYVYGDINNGLDKSMTVIDVSSISPTETLSYFQYESGYYNIRFTISEKKFTYIDFTIGSAWASYKARISKIVGVKSGTLNVEDFTITDAEADAGVAEVWNEVGI